MVREVLGITGTDDDSPRPRFNRVPVEGRAAGNKRSFLASAPYQMIQRDMELGIHELERVAYGSVLRAFKAQSDSLTWEKESLITELRKELRVSDDEHRELFTEANADNLIRTIKEWKEAVRFQNVTGPTTLISRKRPKTSLSKNSFGTPSQSFQPHSVAATTQPISSTARQEPALGTGGQRSNNPTSTLTRHMQYQSAYRASFGASMDDPPESIMGRRVMIRCPSSMNFYDAVISGYDPVDGLHSLVYDSNTPNATMEWVNINEVPHEDIRWVGEDFIPSQLGEAGVPNTGRGQALSANPLANDVVKDSGIIEIFHTDTLIKKVKTLLDASHPNGSGIKKAKKLLKDHEQTLIQVIAKLSEACDRDGEYPFKHGLKSSGKAEPNILGPAIKV